MKGLTRDTAIAKSSSPKFFFNESRDPSRAATPTDATIGNTIARTNTVWLPLSGIVTVPSRMRRSMFATSPFAQHFCHRPLNLWRYKMDVRLNIIHRNTIGSLYVRGGKRGSIIGCPVRPSRSEMASAVPPLGLGQMRVAHLVSL
jgi:hypothetical protein